MTKLKHTSFASSYLEEKNNYRQIVNDGGQLKLSIIAIVFASHPCFFLIFLFLHFFLEAFNLHILSVHMISSWRTELYCSQQSRLIEFPLPF